jgi:hypothetical protein
VGPLHLISPSWRYATVWLQMRPYGGSKRSEKIVDAECFEAPVQACPAGDRQRASGRLGDHGEQDRRTLAPSAGSGCAQMLSGAPSGSARIAATFSMVGSTVPASAVVREKRRTLSGEAGKVDSDTEGSSAWFV